MLEDFIAWFQRLEDRFGQGTFAMILSLVLFAGIMAYAFLVSPI